MEMTVHSGHVLNSCTRNDLVNVKFPCGATYQDLLDLTARPTKNYFSGPATHSLQFTGRYT